MFIYEFNKYFYLFYFNVYLIYSLMYSLEVYLLVIFYILIIFNLKNLKIKLFLNLVKFQINIFSIQIHFIFYLIHKLMSHNLHINYVDIIKLINLMVVVNILYIFSFDSSLRTVLFKYQILF